MSKTFNMMDVERAAQKAMRNNPDGSRKEQFAEFLEVVQKDPRYLVAMADNVFSNYVQKWRVEKIGNSHVVVGSPKTEQSAERIQEREESKKRRDQIMAETITETTRTLVKKISDILTLDYIAPNGKKLRYCTGAELARFGGIFYELSHHLKPNQVLDKHIGQPELRNVCLRFEKSVGKSKTQSKPGGRDNRVSL